MVNGTFPPVWVKGPAFRLTSHALTRRGYLVLRPEASDAGDLVRHILSTPHPELFRIGIRAGVLVALIPKCANTSLARWLTTLEAQLWGVTASRVSFTRSCRDEFYVDLRALPQSLLKSLTTDKVTCIRVVRDPSERALSAFLDKKRNGPGDSIVQLLPKRAWRTFEGFLEVLSEDSSLLYADPHWAPQHWLLGTSAKFFRPIPIFRLDDELSRIARRSGVEAVTTRDGIPGHSTGSAARLRSHRFPGMEDIVQELYGPDVKEWLDLVERESGHPTLTYR